MNIGMPAVILGMTTMTAFIGAMLVTSTLLRADGPLPPRLGFLGSLLNFIFGLLTVTYARLKMSPAYRSATTATMAGTLGSNWSGKGR